MAAGKEGSGHPAVLHTSSRVVDVGPLNATVTLENGASLSGDLVIGADGVSVGIAFHCTTGTVPLIFSIADHLVCFEKICHKGRHQAVRPWAKRLSIHDPAQKYARQSDDP